MASVMIPCPVCGVPFERKLGVPGRPREAHEICALFEVALRQVESRVEEIVFNTSEASIQAQKKLRSRLWSAANTLNGTVAHGGAGAKICVVHLAGHRRALCSTRATQIQITTDPDQVTCKTCLKRQEKNLLSRSAVDHRPAGQDEARVQG